MFMTPTVKFIKIFPTLILFTNKINEEERTKYLVCLHNMHI